jgi:hypothetical protein
MMTDLQKQLPELNEAQHRWLQAYIQEQLKEERTKTEKDLLSFKTAIEERMDKIRARMKET